jgi:hypothetical protein
MPPVAALAVTQERTYSALCDSAQCKAGGESAPIDYGAVEPEENWTYFTSVLILADLLRFVSNRHPNSYEYKTLMH